MLNSQSNISHMQCWLFRLAQSTWKLTLADTIALFKRFCIFEYIADCYDILHLSSYQNALSDIETMLACKGITVSTDRSAGHSADVTFDNSKDIYSTTVSDETKEACAVETIHYMVKQYAVDNNLSFEDAFFAFAASTTYEVLFDFETEVWKEGPDYIGSLFEKAISTQYSQ